MAFISYAVQSAIIMGSFAIMYHLFFRRLTFFTINRYYLILTFVFSLIIPAIKVQVDEPIVADAVSGFNETYGRSIQAEMLSNVAADSFIVDAHKKEVSAFNLQEIIFVAYLLVCTLLFARLLYAVSLLIIKTRSGEKAEGFIWIKPFAKFDNCSFFNLLIVDKAKLTAFELEQVLAHEREHKRKWHSFDQLIVETVLVLLWFNPFVYYYRNAIRAVHEFEVDQRLSAYISKEKYGNLLLKLATPSATYLTHGFSQHSLRRRIQFLFGKRSNRLKKMGYSAVVPLLVLIVAIFSFQKAEAIGAMMHLQVLQKQSAQKEFTTDCDPAVKEERQPVSAGHNQDLELASLILSDIINPVLSGDLKITGLLEGIIADSKLTVVIDPGHGGEDKGGSFNGVLEKDIVLQLATKMKDVLENEGFNVVLTRENDEFVSLKDRVSVKGDIFVSIHANSHPQNANIKMSGMELYIPNKGRLKDSVLLNKSLNLASHVRSALTSLDLGIREEFKDISLFVLNNNTKPALLFEMGYIDNPKDFKFLTDNTYQLKLAKNFAGALKKYRENIKYSYSPKLGDKEDSRFSAEDSITFNKEKTVMKLYGNAKVQTNQTEVSADEIVVDLKSGKVKAVGNHQP